MKLSKLFVFALAGFICLSIVVLTARQILITEVAKPHVVLTNAKILNEKAMYLGTTMVLKEDKVLALGDSFELSSLPEGTVTLDMEGKMIMPGRVIQAQELTSDLLAKGVTTVQLSEIADSELEEYYWGRQHGMYDVRVQVLESKAPSSVASDHLFFIGDAHANGQLVGSLIAGGFADFQVFNRGKLEQTWLGGVKQYQAQ